MTVDPNATGTTGQDPQGGGNPTGTAADPPAGGPAGDESLDAVKAERDRLKEANDQWLREKSNVEEERRRFRDSEAELQRLRQGGGYQPPTAANPALAQLQKDYADAQAGDPDAILRVVAAVGQTTQSEVQNLRRENAYNREMASVPADMEKEVERRMAAMPGLSPSWAMTQIKAERLDREEAAIAERRRKLDEEEAARKRGRVDTTVTGIAGGDLHNAGMTAKDLAELSRKADGGDAKAAERLRAFDRGELGRLREA